jgi:hypothetical protein
MADDEPSAAARQKLYAAVLRAIPRTGRTPARLAVAPDEPWLHVMAQPTARGTMHVIYNKKSASGTADVSISTAAGPVTLTTRNRWPALAAVTNQGAVVAVNACGKASIGDKPLMGGAGLKALLALDGQDLRASRAILVAPFEPGRAELPRCADPAVVLVGEFQDGRWTTLEQIPLEANQPALEIDADRAACLILVCPASETQRWTDRLTQAMLRPDQIAGY